MIFYKCIIIQLLSNIKTFIQHRRENQYFNYWFFFQKEF